MKYEFSIEYKNANGSIWHFRIIDTAESAAKKFKETCGDVEVLSIKKWKV